MPPFSDAEGEFSSLLRDCDVSTGTAFKLPHPKILPGLALTSSSAPGRCRELWLYVTLLTLQKRLSVTSLMESLSAQALDPLIWTEIANEHSLLECALVDGVIVTQPALWVIGFEMARNLVFEVRPWINASSECHNPLSLHCVCFPFMFLQQGFG